MPGFYFKMCVQLILKLSVFSLFCVFLKEETVLQVTSDSRFLNHPPDDENRRPALNMLPIESVGFTCVTNVYSELEGFRWSKYTFI